MSATVSFFVLTLNTKNETAAIVFLGLSLFFYIIAWIAVIIMLGNLSAYFEKRFKNPPPA